MKLRSLLLPAAGCASAGSAALSRSELAVLLVLWRSPGSFLRLAGQLGGSAAGCSKRAAEEWASSACFAGAASGCKLAGHSPCKLPLRLGLLQTLLARQQLAASGGSQLPFFPPPYLCGYQQQMVPLCAGQ